MADSDTRLEGAEGIVKSYMLGALGVGLVPLPLVDMAALAAIQLKMLHGLANLYEVDYSSQIGKSLIASLVSPGIGTPVILSFKGLAVKSIPLFGWALALISTSLFCGASTYAVGKVFIQHFESGCTFLTFDPRQVRNYYAQQYKKGKEEVRQSFVGVKP